MRHWQCMTVKQKTSEVSLLTPITAENPAKRIISNNRQYSYPSKFHVTHPYKTDGAQCVLIKCNVAISFLL